MRAGPPAARPGAPTIWGMNRDGAPAPLYRRDGAWFIPAPHTASPWSERAQHGGPVAALLARAVEKTLPEGMSLSRLTVELLGPIPILPLRIDAEITRPGRRVQMTSAQAVDQHGRPLVLARAWGIRTLAEPLALPGLDSTAYPPPPAPHRSPPEPDLFHGIVDYPHFYGLACERRLADGTTDSPGPAVVWFRWLCPLVAGEEMTGAQRAVGISDSAQGVSWMVRPDRHIFINPDLTVTLWREPEGEWTALAARSRLHADGRGASDSLLFDQRGDAGRVSQSVLLDRAAPPDPP